MKKRIVRTGLLQYSIAKKILTEEAEFEADKEPEAEELSVLLVAVPVKDCEEEAAVPVGEAEPLLGGAAATPLRPLLEPPESPKSNRPGARFLISRLRLP